MSSVSLDPGLKPTDARSRPTCISAINFVEIADIRQALGQGIADTNYHTFQHSKQTLVPSKTSYNKEFLAQKHSGTGAPDALTVLVHTLHTTPSTVFTGKFDLCTRHYRF